MEKPLGGSLEQVGGVEGSPLGRKPTHAERGAEGWMSFGVAGGEKWGCAKTPLLAGCPLWVLGIERRTSRCVGRTGRVEGSRGAKGLTVADPK